MARRAPPSEGDRRALVVSRRGRFFVGEPLFDRGEQIPLSRGGPEVGEGRIALCRIGARGAQPLADLGRADRPRNVVDALLADRGERPTFPKRLEREAEAAGEIAGGVEARRIDLRSRPTFTVDPKTARDFDDAVSAEPEGEGWRLWIHIADVAAHVRPESGLDREAAGRGNSIYVPGTVCPMLPEALSTGHCSLNPGVDRLAVTAEIVLDLGAEPLSASFYRSTIRSDARLDYEQLDRVFAGAERAAEVVAEPIRLARAAAQALADRRGGRGLVVTSSEPELSFDSEGRVEAAKIVEDTEAHRLIEKLMVLCNEEVAKLCERKRWPAPYRVHEQPSPERIVRLTDQLASLDLPTPAVADPETLTPQEAGELAIEASRLVDAEATRRGHGARAWSSLVLRALKPAHYSERNRGHAGLGSAAYTHFTSPIRRYPDLLAHRALLAGVGLDELPPDPSEVAAACEHCSETERDAMRLERDGDDICLAYLLGDELGERGWDTKLAGEVSGVIGAGAFVTFEGERSDAYEGFLPARWIPGDRYELAETEVALVGLNSGRRIGFGDRLEVVVDKIEAPRGRVDLKPAGDGQPDSRSGGKGSKGGKGPKGRKGGGGGKAAQRKGARGAKVRKKR
ncbi:MAG: RNB domain-containing ribonuclease [Solirubrobacterales bacterium]